MKPCHQCGKPAIKHRYCADHLHQLYATYTSTSFAYQGIGLPHGNYLKCTACNATWQGQIGDPCNYCRRSHQLLIQHQHDLALTPPDVNPDEHDDTKRARYIAWVERLKHAINIGIITDHEARHAITRTQQ
jgi:hypothetical protein